MNYIARGKVWISTDGSTLVADGGKDAKFLFARKGQRKDEKTLARFENAEDFFEGKKTALDGHKPKEVPIRKSLGRKKKLTQLVGLILAFTLTLHCFGQSTSGTADNSTALPTLNTANVNQTAAASYFSPGTGIIQRIAQSIPVASSTNGLISGTAGVTGTIPALAQCYETVIYDTGTGAAFVRVSGTTVNSGTFDFIANPAAAGIYSPLTLNTGSNQILVNVPSGTASVHWTQIIAP